MIDLYNDPAHTHLRRLLDEFPGVQPLLKSAEFEDTREELPANCFADLSRQRFPLHTPEHAVVSFLYANGQHAPPGVMNKIAEALYAYNIDAAIFVPGGQAKVAAEKRASLFDDGTYPVSSPAEVRMAESRLFEEVHQIPLDSRAQVFNKLAHAAEAQGVELSPRAQAWGLVARCNPEELAVDLRARATLCKTAEDAEEYLQLAQSLDEDPHAVRQYGVRVKLAETLLGLDARTGVDAYYERRVPDALCSVFNTPVKLGEQLFLLGGKSYDLSHILGLPVSFFQDTLGPEFVSEIAPGGVLNPEALLEVLPTLPADLLAHFEQGLASAGVKPTGV